MVQNMWGFSKMEPGMERGISIFLMVKNGWENSEKINRGTSHGMTTREKLLPNGEMELK